MSVTSVLLPRTRVVVCAVGIALGASSAFGQAAAAQQAAPPPAAQDAGAQQIRDELDRLRREFESVRDTYGARLTALEAKLAQFQGTVPSAAAPPAAPEVTAAVPPAVANAAGLRPRPTSRPVAAAEPVPQAAGAPESAPPVYGGNAASQSKVFNPDIAVIGNFTGAAGTNHIDERPSLDMGESEASFQAIVDPYARADFFFSFSPEGVEVEEGFITFTSLPGGLLAKVGKFREQIGKVNTMHAHVLPWVDEPLVLTNLLGSEEGISDSGISVSKLVLNPWFFLEATGEVYQGNAGTLPVARAQRRELRRPGARLSRPHRGHQPRRRRLVRPRPQRRRPGLHDPALHGRRDGALPAAAARHLPAR